MSLEQKAWRVIMSCQTYTQALVALRYLELLSLTDSTADVLKLRRELTTLWGVV